MPSFAAVKLTIAISLSVQNNVIVYVAMKTLVTIWRNKIIIP